MRWIAVLAVLSANQAVADDKPYATCVGMLDAALKTKAGVDAMLDSQYAGLFNSAKADVTEPAREASVKAQGEINAALSAYIASLAVACEGLRE